MPAIETQGLTKWYGALHVLDAINFEATEGEFVSVVGPSGCGKTTFLKTLGGLSSPTSGTVKVHGLPVRSAPRGQFGFVFQNPVLLRWRTVLENAALPLEVLGRPVDNGPIREMLRLVGLEEFASTHPHKLSGGMQQRVAIVRALVFEPRILLMDEPFGALDEITRETLNELLLQVWETMRKTVIFVTHSLPEAIFMSDRVIVLSQRPARVERTIPVDLPRPRLREFTHTSHFQELLRCARESLEI